MHHTLIVDGFVASKVPSKFYSIVINECGSTAWSLIMAQIIDLLSPRSSSWLSCRHLSLVHLRERESEWVGGLPCKQ